jgi:hypothetical protein
MAGESARPPGVPNLFPHIARLQPHGAAAAGKLQAVHGDLVRLGAAADADRLAALDKLAERRDYESLERLTAAGLPLDDLSEVQHSRVRRVVGLRNAAALLPLLTTWLLLGWASIDYRNELVAHPLLSRQPFLILWQQHFGDRLIPTFAQTALVAFVLLVVVLILTVAAHNLESRASRQLATVGSKLDDAMNSVALVIETSNVQPPATAAEWAEAAQRVLSETQQMLGTAVQDIEKLAKANNEISHTAEQAMARLQTQAEDFVTGLAAEVKELMLAIRADNAQVVTRTAEEAKNVLQQAGAANKQLIDQQMTPLFEGFRASLDDYRASAAALAGGVADLSKSAAVIAQSADSYTDVAKSIDAQLRLIGTSQTNFVTRITENSQSIATATTAMREVTDLMTGRMRTDIEELAKNVLEASARLVAVDQDLATTSSALGDTTGAMRRTAASLADAAAAAARAAAAASAAASLRRGLWSRLFGER